MKSQKQSDQESPPSIHPDSENEIILQFNHLFSDLLLTQKNDFERQSDEVGEAK